ncbi:hypothetical protein NPS53_08635 [Pseudomonas putida]|uniref:hypothetical protein n=1 Tax=Pseudomonas putida TaxID=303 RepID=UPI0023632A88|nr:hypothetical protein [Pseudomonas putida]MDD2139639.1 hypothetical protein [Pseudomonas putida]HDS1721562.1 hypothetical protein [Pseudomonas putida]
MKSFAEKAYADATARHVVAQGAETARLAKVAEQSQPDVPVSKDIEPSKKGEADGHESSATPQDQNVEEGKGSGAPVIVVPANEATDAKSESPSPSSDISKPEAPTPIPDGSLPKLAFGVAAVGASASDADGYQPSTKVIQSKEAGALLNVGPGPISDPQLELAAKIADKELRADALSGLLSLHSRSMSDSQVNTLLNELYALDKGQYANALIVKLPGLLNVGDLERAKALREVLLGAKVSPDRTFSMLAYVASCYTMAGLKQDAGAIVIDAIPEGAKLSADDQRLISLSISVSNGSYPMVQDFWDFKSDEARLSAYLTIAVIARQLDSPAVAHQAVADAVKFIQKSGAKLDRTKALSQILAVSPGVI